MYAELRRCAEFGTPRPESQAIFKGHDDLPRDGRETCAVTVTSSARLVAMGSAQCCPSPAGCSVQRAHPLTGQGMGQAHASPVVWQTWAWCRSRSTVAAPRDDHAHGVGQGRGLWHECWCHGASRGRAAPSGGVRLDSESYDA